MLSNNSNKSVPGLFETQSRRTLGLVAGMNSVEPRAMPTLPSSDFEKRVVFCLMVARIYVKLWKVTEHLRRLRFTAEHASALAGGQILFPVEMLMLC